MTQTNVAAFTFDDLTDFEKETLGHLSFYNERKGSPYPASTKLFIRMLELGFLKKEIRKSKIKGAEPTMIYTLAEGMRNTEIYAQCMQLFNEKREALRIACEKEDAEERIRDNAQELLNVIEELVKVHDNDNVNNIRGTEEHHKAKIAVWKKARSAIAKARGE